MAQFLWWTLIAVHCLWAAWGLVADWVLIGAENESLTRYLRENVWAFFIPSLFGLLAWVVLYWHLFIQSRAGQGGA